MSTSDSPSVATSRPVGPRSSATRRSFVFTRVSANWNHLWFDSTEVVQVLRSEGSIPKAIGHDVSVAGIWRPWANQNAVIRLSGAVFDPSDGFGDLFVARGRDDRFYSVLANATFAV